MKYYLIKFDIKNDPGFLLRNLMVDTFYQVWHGRKTSDKIEGYCIANIDLDGEVVWHQRDNLSWMEFSGLPNKDNIREYNNLEQMLEDHPEIFL